ncbi:PKD domain-containing protein [Methanogenium cariaci]|uniref:PKD domain-containing protein n=1 Tax=Methanogenium cariaci TaxID=2197 RepID=UPI0007808C8C|nr:PKD domain-containing protein [Methanogenium cariaci]
MKKSTLPPLSQRILNLPDGIQSGLLITLVAVLVICACAVPAVSADTPLTVSFTFSPSSPDANEPVSFSGSSTWSNITNWAWNFGDGSSSASQNPTHTYANAGTYSVSLTASNTAGTATSSPPQSVTVNAVANPPVASFSFSPTSPGVGQAVSFTDASTGDAITSWSWSFGDGQGNTLQNPSHVYTYEGTYTVSLTVTNAAGTSSPVTRSITVTAAENPPVASFSFSPHQPCCRTGCLLHGCINEWRHHIMELEFW